MELPFAVDASTMMPKPDESSSTASSLVTSSSQGSLIPAEQPQHLQQQQHHHHHHQGSEHPHYHDHHQPHPPPPTNVAYRTQSAATPIHQQHHHHQPDAPLSSFANTGVALKAAGSKVSSVLMNFGFNRNSNNNRSDEIPLHSATHQAMNPPPQQHQQQYDNQETTIDFAYINVTDEDEVDIWLDDRNHNTSHSSTAVVGEGDHDSNDETGANNSRGRTDVLAVLLQQQEGRLVEYTENANQAAAQADAAKKVGNLQEALNRHTESARLFHEAAVLVKEHDGV